MMTMITMRMIMTIMIMNYNVTCDTVVDDKANLNI